MIFHFPITLRVVFKLPIKCPFSLYDYVYIAVILSFPRKYNFSPFNRSSINMDFTPPIALISTQVSGHMTLKIFTIYQVIKEFP